MQYTTPYMLIESFGRLYEMLAQTTLKYAETLHLELSIARQPPTLGSGFSLGFNFNVWSLGV